MTLPLVQMSLSNGQTRREAIGAAAAGAAVVTAMPLSASAKNGILKAPIITMFDGRGCTEHKNREYTGPRNGGIEDELCVKVQYETIRSDETNAFGILKEVLSQLKKN
jgi:hypothetical protein